MIDSGWETIMRYVTLFDNPMVVVDVPWACVGVAAIVLGIWWALPLTPGGACRCIWCRRYRRRHGGRR